MLYTDNEQITKTWQRHSPLVIVIRVAINLCVSYIVYVVSHSFQIATTFQSFQSPVN